MGPALVYEGRRLRASEPEACHDNCSHAQSSQDQTHPTQCWPRLKNRKQLHLQFVHLQNDDDDEDEDEDEDEDDEMH